MKSSVVGVVGVCGVAMIVGLSASQSVASGHPLLASPQAVESWQNDKVGLFIHWGPGASRIGVDLSWGRGRDRPFDAPFSQSDAFNVINHRDPLGANAAYDVGYTTFDPRADFADHWATVAENNGFQYMVLTAKHHMGLPLFRSSANATTAYELEPVNGVKLSQTPWYVQNRDLAGEFADAARAHGRKVGFYYSPRDWSHPDYLVDADGAGPQVKNQAYLQYYRQHLSDLVNNYGDVDILWFDSTGNSDVAWVQQQYINNGGRQPNLFPPPARYRAEWSHWDHDKTIEILRTGNNPNIIVNDRMAAILYPGRGATNFIRSTNHPEYGGDFITAEQKVGAYDPYEAWESSFTIQASGRWGYDGGDNQKSVETLVDLVINTVGGGGNALMNISPTYDGTIPPSQINRLNELGQVLNANAEAIYGTSAGLQGAVSWGATTTRNNGGRVYVHILDQSRNGDTLAIRVDQQRFGGLGVRSNSAYLLTDPNQQFDVHRRDFNNGDANYRSGFVFQAPATLAPTDTVLVFDTYQRNVNLAQGKTATQSSIWDNNASYSPDAALDDHANTFTHTALGDLTPFWRVDLASDFLIHEVFIVNRDVVQERLRDIIIHILDANQNVVAVSDVLNPNNALNGPSSLAWDGGDLGTGQFVRILRTTGQGGNTPGQEGGHVLTLAEVRIYGEPVAAPEPASLALMGMMTVLVITRPKSAHR